MLVAVACGDREQNGVDPLVRLWRFWLHFEQSPETGLCGADCRTSWSAVAQHMSLGPDLQKSSSPSVQLFLENLTVYSGV